MNVLLVNRTALNGKKGGMARSIETLGSALAGQIRVVTFVPGPPNQHRLATGRGTLGMEYRLALPLPFGSGSPLTRYAAWAVHFPQAVLRVRALVKREGIDLVHTTFHSENIVFWMLRALFGLPYVVTLHGSDAVYLDRVPGPHRRLAERVVKGANAVVAVSAAVKAAAERWFGEAAPIVPIHNGVDVTGIAVEAARAKLPGNLPARYILALGALVPVKGIDLLVTAWADVAPRFPSVQLVVAGDGPERDRLQALAKQLGIADRVAWVGWVNHETAMGLMNRALAYVMPSRSEGLGYGILEAGACGVPVVAAEVGGIPEVVAHAATGLLVSPEDPAALASALRSVLEAPEAAARRAHALRARVADDFSLQALVRKHIELYQRVLARNGV